MGLSRYWYCPRRLGCWCRLVWPFLILGVSSSPVPAFSALPSSPHVSDQKILSGTLLSLIQCHLLWGRRYLRCYHGHHLAGKNQRTPTTLQWLSHVLRLLSVLDRRFSRNFELALRVRHFCNEESALESQAVDVRSQTPKTQTHSWRFWLWKFSAQL